MRFAALHTGPMLKWHAAALQALLERPGTVLAERRELIAPRVSRSALALLGFPARGTLLDESQSSCAPDIKQVGGELDFCVAFDAGAAMSAPASRLGTWQFDSDGAQSAPGLNAFCDGSDVVEARLLQIDGNGEITCLRSGVLGVNRGSLALTINGLLGEMSTWPAESLREVEDGIAQNSPASPPVAIREPTFSTIARAAAALSMNRLMAIVEKRFYTYSWNIGIANATPEQIVRSSSLPPVAWCKEGRRRFLADPFGAAIDGVISAYCEEIDPATSRGVILRLDVVDGELKPAERVLDESYHLSYPYLFEHQNVWYAIPESGQNDEVALYRLEKSGRKWRKHSVLIPGLRAVDSTVFVHGGKFWLLCGMNDDGPNHKLHVYHSDALTGPWRPHPRNPVKIDIRSARPAGAPFLVGGVLHRPAQDCTRKYGRRLTILRMTAIDEREFKEETVAVIEPPRGMYARGLHTLSPIGTSTLVDGLHRDFSLRAAGWRTLRSIRRLLGLPDQTETDGSSDSSHHRAISHWK